MLYTRRYLHSEHYIKTGTRPVELDSTLLYLHITYVSWCHYTCYLRGTGGHRFGTVLGRPSSFISSTSRECHTRMVCTTVVVYTSRVGPSRTDLFTGGEGWKWERSGSVLNKVGS